MNRNGSGTVVVTLLLIALVTTAAACAAEPQALPVDESPESAQDTDATGSTAEVSLTEGYRPFAHRYTGYFGTFDRSAERDMPESIGDPPIDGLGPLVITASVERFPISCVRWHRTIIGVDVGDGPAAAHMGARIAELATDLHAEYLERFSTEDDCNGLTGATAIGESYQELRELPCEVPGGLILRCFEFGGFGGYPGIANGFVTHHQLVFDTSTGDRLSLGDLFASVGITEHEGIELVKGIITEFNDWDATVRQAIPTREGMTFGFSPYEAGPGVDGSLALFVPWSLIEAAKSSD